MLGLVLSGCGGSESSTAKSDTLTVALGGDPLTLNPYDFKAGVNFYGLRQMYETLLEHDNDGKLIPNLAEKWDVSEDGKIVTFQLRKNVKFHDGSTMTAADVKFSLERFADPKIMPYAFLMKPVTKISTPDDATVVVEMNSPNPIFLSGAGLTFVVPKSIGDKPYEYLDAKADGTGPLKLVDRKIGKGFTLERFDQYWGEKAGYKTVDVKIIADANARVSALRSGQVDFIAPVPPQNMKQLESKFTVKSTIDAGAIGITFDQLSKGEAGVVANPDVRRAMDLAIDRKPIVDAALAGMGVGYGGIGPQNEGGDRVEATKYDPTEAKALIKKAGAEGKTVKLYVPKNGRIVNSEQVGQAVAGYWDAIGLKTDLRIVSYEEWIDREKNGPAQTYMSSFPDDFGWSPFLRIQSFYGCGGDNSLQCDKEYDKILATAAVAKSQDEFVDGYVEAVEYIQQKTLGIQLHVAKSGFAMNKSVCWEPPMGRSVPLLTQIKPCA